MEEDPPKPRSDHKARRREAVANAIVPKRRMCGPQVRFCERGPWETGGPFSAKSPSEVSRDGGTSSGRGRWGTGLCQRGGKGQDGGDDRGVARGEARQFQPGRMGEGEREGSSGWAA